MSTNYDADDLARLLALEYAFGTLAFISACNFAQLSNMKPTAAVDQFRSVIEGSLYDRADYPADVRELIRSHLKRMFDYVAGMAEHADAIG